MSRGKIFYTKYHSLSGWRVASIIADLLKNNAPLTAYQEDVLREKLGNSGRDGDLDMPFQAYEWEEATQDGKNAWWRLTIIFYIPVYILSGFLNIFHWIFTGKWYLSPNSWYSVIMRKWGEHLFDEY